MIKVYSFKEYFKKDSYMSEQHKMNIVLEKGVPDNFSLEIQTRIIEHISEEYKESISLKITSDTTAELYVTKNIIFTNSNGYNIEAESPEFRFKTTPTYFINLSNNSVEAVINPKYKAAISSDFSSLRIEYTGAKSIPFLLGKLFNEGFKFSMEINEVNGFVVENVSSIHSNDICTEITKKINQNHKENVYFRIEDDTLWVIAKKSLETMKTQYSNAPYEKLFSYPLSKDGFNVDSTPLLSKNKEFYNELQIPMFVYSKNKPQVLSQIESMLNILYGKNFTLELNYDEDKKVDIAVIRLTNALYKLEISNLAYVYKNNKLLNISEKSDPYSILMKEMAKPYIEHLPVKNWNVSEYDGYAPLVHSGLFY